MNNELQTRIHTAIGKRSVSIREWKIMQHYSEEIAKGHMTLNTAFERACADIAGANGHPTKVQRSLKEAAQ